MKKLRPSSAMGRHTDWALVALTIAVYALALTFQRDAIPAGLANDAAEEAIRGLILLGERRFEPIATVLGYSAETLYLYAMALVATSIGTITLAIHLTSWVFAIAFLVLFVVFARDISPEIPRVLAAVTAATSVWLFHYARSGLRAISAPVFVLAFLVLWKRARPNNLAAAAAAGAVLGLGLYGYTAFRVVPVAWLLYELVVFVRSRKADRLMQLRVFGVAVVAASIVSIPNLRYLLQDPGAFFGRGSYVFVARGSSALGNVVASLLLPFTYLDRYNEIRGPHHFFDGITVSLTSAGINPIHPIISVAILFGLIQLFRKRMAGLLPLLVYAVALVALGPAGPSLTRFLIVLPILLLPAASALSKLRPAWWIPLLAVVALTEGYSYFKSYPRNLIAQSYFSPAATPIGQRARELASEGRKVLCVITKDASVIRYLSFDVAKKVRVVEFYGIPYDPARIPPDFQPAAMLIERSDVLASAIPGGKPLTTRAEYVEVAVD